MSFKDLIVPKTKPPEGYGQPKGPENLLPAGFSDKPASAGTTFQAKAEKSDVGKLTYQGLSTRTGKDGKVETVAEFHEYFGRDRAGKGVSDSVYVAQDKLGTYLKDQGPISPDIDKFNKGQFGMAQMSFKDPTQVMDALIKSLPDDPQVARAQAFTLDLAK